MRVGVGLGWSWVEMGMGVEVQFKMAEGGISLEVQWLRLHLLMQRVWVQTLVRELRSLLAHDRNTKT